MHKCPNHYGHGMHITLVLSIHQIPGATWSIFYAIINAIILLHYVVYVYMHDKAA